MQLAQRQFYSETPFEPRQLSRNVEGWMLLIEKFISENGCIFRPVLREIYGRDQILIWLERRFGPQGYATQARQILDAPDFQNIEEALLFKVVDDHFEPDLGSEEQYPDPLGPPIFAGAQRAILAQTKHHQRLLGEVVEQVNFIHDRLDGIEQGLLNADLSVLEDHAATSRTRTLAPGNPPGPVHQSKPAILESDEIAAAERPTFGYDASELDALSPVDEGEVPEVSSAPMPPPPAAPEPISSPPDAPPGEAPEEDRALQADSPDSELEKGADDPGSLPELDAAAPEAELDAAEPEAELEPEPEPLPLIMPPLDEIVEILRILVDDDIDIEEAELDFNNYIEANAEKLYSSTVLDDEGNEVGLLIADVPATVFLSGTMIMVPQNDMERQVQEEEPTEEIVETMSEIFNNLTSPFNIVEGNPHIRSKPAESLQLERDAWLLEDKARLAVSVNLGGLLLFASKY